MKWLLRTYGSVKSFYEQYSTYMDGLFKFGIAVITFLTVIYCTGYNQGISSPLVAVVLAILCAFLPTNYISIFLALLLVIEFLSVSTEIAVIALVLFLLMLLLYFVFKAESSLIMTVTMTFCLMGLSPMVLPIALLVSPVDTLVVAFGVLLYGIVSVVRKDIASLTSTSLSLGGRVNLFLTDLMSNSRFLLLLGALCAVFLAITMLKRSKLNYSSLLAMAFGDFIYTVFILLGIYTMNVAITVPGFIIGMLLNFLMSFLLIFVIKRLDFKRCEEVQFEDDEYFYYVKAVPKGMISATERKREVVTDEGKQTADTGHLFVHHHGFQGGRSDE